MAHFLKAVRIRLARGLVFSVEVVEHFLGNNCPQLAAALAYYALFSIPPLIVIVVVCVGAFVDPEQVQIALAGSVSRAFPPRFAEQSVALIQRAHGFVDHGSWWSLALSLVGVIFGATHGFVQLQTALNRAWSIRGSKGRPIVVDFLFKRLISFVLVLGVVLFVGFSTLATTLLVRFEREIFGLLPGIVHGPLEVGLASVVSLGLMTGVLLLVYRFLPDAKIAWRQVLPGALFAAVGLELLKSLMALYFKHQELTDLYGQAGSIAALLVWLYASANVVFLGAEVARVWSGRKGSALEMEHGARLSRDAVPLELAPKLRRALLSE